MPSGPLRPAVFIGSSAEGLDAARAIQVLLDRSCEVEIWSQGTFGPGGGTLESLVSAVDRFDFAILIVNPDDTAISRGQQKSVPRDNVILSWDCLWERLAANVRSWYSTARDPLTCLAT
jgi:predicted nucleotide-binding protein